MAINRFALVTDGFGKPATITGTDWANKVPRALLLTKGYLNRGIGVGKKIKKSKFLYWMTFFYGRRG